MKKIRAGELVKNLTAGGGIIVFFIMAFEVMIMISPFAFFFYSVFNPIFHWLNQYTAIRWLTSFFLPHMILPPTPLLRAIRILGSAFFIVGSLAFVVCALQVYLGKIFKHGVAAKGLYKYIRHPQYLMLGVWGLGMAILWPRFIVLASLSVMFILYYFLAKDEERRMLNQYGQSYREYMKTAGMFFPRFIEKRFAFFGCLIPKSQLKFVTVPVVIITVVIGTGFIFRTLTLRSLFLPSQANVTLVSILPEDSKLSANVLNGIFVKHVNHFHSRISFLKGEDDYLGYLMPADYIMQGMIADTGSQCQLYKKHHTIAMITDWVLHPFEHLRRPPSVHMAKMHNVEPAIARRHHCPIGINNSDLECETCPYRRVIFVQVKHNYNGHVTGKRILSFNTTRLPVGFIDINTQTGELVNVKLVGEKTAWKDVPTPTI